MELVAERPHQHNAEVTGARFDFPGQGDDGFSLDLAVKDARGAVVGGISAGSVLGLMWLEVLWVDEELRRRGLASWLVLEAEKTAHEKGCIASGTWTFSWQGADFYPTIGYELRGVFSGYPFGVTEHVLTKRLPNLEALRAAREKVARNERGGFRLVTSPTSEDMRLVGKGLYWHCARHAGEEMDNPGITVRLVLRDSEGLVVGGLDAYTTIRIMALEALWVDSRYRGQGYGRKLLTRAEEIAKEHGCISVSSHCLSFQSPEFFHRLGYGVFGTVDAYVDGHTEELLIKRL
jgi:GNAT superfamily N-acetyltransferase